MHWTVVRIAPDNRPATTTGNRALGSRRQRLEAVDDRGLEADGARLSEVATHRRDFGDAEAEPPRLATDVGNEIAAALNLRSASPGADKIYVDAA